MKKLLTLVVVLSVKLTFAQQPAEVWETIDSYQSPGIGITVRHSINDDAGNTYSTGYFYGPSSDHDMFVSKHDNNGNLVFNDTYDSGIGYDWGIEVGYDNSGNTYVVANIRGATIFEASAVMTRKYGPTGTLLWTNLYYSAIISARANDMQVNKNSGEVYIVGYSANQVTGDAKNLMVLKYLTDGTLSWSKSFDGGSSIDDIAYLMKLDNTGSIYVLGETNAAVLGPPGTNILLKYTTTGSLSWSKLPQTSGENGGAVMRNEGANFSVYDYYTKQRYSKSTGLLNETVTFENTFQVSSPVLRYWKLGDGRYVRTMSPNFIKVFDATGTLLSTTSISQYTDIQMGSDNSLYLCSPAPGDSAEVEKRSLVGDSYNGVDFNYRFYQASGAWPKFDLSDNNTFTVASQYSTGSVITHRACIPPNVSVTMTGLELSGNVCPGDTVFFNAVSDYANSYSWWGNNPGLNTDSMYIWGGNSPFITPLSLGLTVDAGNGCMVDVDMDFGGYQLIDTYIVDFVGNCENDQGHLMSLSTGGIYRFNWYYNGVQQTFDALDYNYYLTQGNGSYELSLLDTQTGCRSIPHATLNVTTIQPQDDASYSYALANYCPSEADPTPTITGNLGGTFTATPVGLSMNASTGEVDLSLSTPGPYTVSYATNGTCPDTVEFNLSIDPLEDASFSYASINFCGNDPNAFVTITGTAGGTFSATPAGLSINPSTGEIDFSLSTANTYSVDYQTNGACPVSSQVNVIVTLEDVASVSYPVLSYCQDEADPTPSITGTLGGTFSATPAGLVINSSTGEIDLSLSTPAAYTVKYLTNGTCPDSISGTITINALDNAGFSFASLNYCENDANVFPSITGTLGGTFSATPAGLSINPSTGEINFGTSTANTYLIDYQTNGTCPTSSQVSITLTLADFALVSYPGLSYCQNEANPIPSIMGTPGGTFSAVPAGLTINALTGEIDMTASAPNTYTIQYLTGGTCPDSTSSFITIDPLDDASFTYSSGTFCLSGSDPLPMISGLSGGTFSGTGGVAINPSTGEINIASSGLGSYTITYQTNGNCPNSTDFNLVITDSPDASFSYNPIVFCVSESPILAQFGAGASGGTFSAVPSGLSINLSTGEIDPAASTPNVYTVTNYIAASGGCTMTSSDFQVEVLAMDNASFTYSQSNYLTSDPNPTPTITGLVGGSFSESSGNVVLDGLTGEIDLASSTIGGPYTIEYLTSGLCPSTETFQLTIEEPLSLSNQEFGHVVVYPNPVSDILYIDSEEKQIEHIEIYDLNGRLVYQTTDTDYIDVSQLKPSVYFILLRSNDTVYQTKMIKK